MSLATLAGKMELSFPLGIRALSRKYTDHALMLFSHIINPLLTKLTRSRWLDIGLVLFCVFHARKKLGQYPAILTSRLVNNPYIYFQGVRLRSRDIPTSGWRTSSIKLLRLEGFKMVHAKYW